MTVVTQSYTAIISYMTLINKNFSYICYPNKLFRMISRRNIRVKVMQALYSAETDNSDFTTQKLLRMVESQLYQTRQLFTYLVYFISEVARFAETDALKRASKHLPSAEDLKVNTKLAGNELLWKILENKSFQDAMKTFKCESLIDKDLLKRVYVNLTQSEIYQTYISEQSREKKSEKDIIELIFNELMLPNKDFTDHLEDFFVHWDDDAEMMVLMMENFIQKPLTYNFLELISEEKIDYSKKLAQTTFEKKDYCLEQISPKLNNWDSERIAILDMVLMRMGLCEFLYFETIPAKVTLNEYIDLAKEYSTEQSGHFINGILDSIHKDLIETNKLNKVDYKK
jgi:N utilization substance protein B